MVFFLPNSIFKGMDPIKIYGKIHAPTESPFVRKQIKLDSTICLLFILVNVLGMLYESKERREVEAFGFKTNYENFVKLDVKDLK